MGKTNRCQQKLNRGKYQAVALPARSGPPPAEAAAAAAAAAAAPITELDPATGKLRVPWVGSEWSSVKFGIKQKQAPLTYEQMAAKFPGIPQPDDAQRQLFPTGAEAASDKAQEADMDMEAADATSSAAGAPGASAAKQPVVSLSRRTPSKSRPATRAGSPSRSPDAASSPAAAPTTSAAAAAAAALTPSRMSVTGAAWKSPAISAVSTPSRVLGASLLKSKTLRKSWNEKQRQREAAAEAKALQRKLEEAAAEERRAAARARAQKAAYKKEQESKNQVVQVISDTRKIKSMSRKQLRQLQKMDTGSVGRAPKQVTSKLLSRGLAHKAMAD